MTGRAAPRFIADAHLGALARRLRMLGFDTLYCNDLGDAALVRLAIAEDRILLTRDRALLERRTLGHACYLQSKDPDAQLLELIRGFDLCAALAPFSRCLVCNTPVEAVTADEAAPWVPQGVRERFSDYWRCSGCGRVYWPGSHWQAMCLRIRTWCQGAKAGEGKER